MFLRKYIRGHTSTWSSVLPLLNTVEDGSFARRPSDNDASTYKVQVGPALTHEKLQEESNPAMLQ